MHWSADVIDFVAGVVRPPGRAFVSPDTGVPFPIGKLGTTLEREGTPPTGKIDPTFGKV